MLTPNVLYSSRIQAVFNKTSSFRERWNLGPGSSYICLIAFCFVNASLITSYTSILTCILLVRGSLIELLVNPFAKLPLEGLFLNISSNQNTSITHHLSDWLLCTCSFALSYSQFRKGDIDQYQRDQRDRSYSLVSFSNLRLQIASQASHWIACIHSRTSNCFSKYHLK